MTNIGKSIKFVCCFFCKQISFLPFLHVRMMYNKALTKGKETKEKGFGIEHRNSL